MIINYSKYCKHSIKFDNVQSSPDNIPKLVVSKKEELSTVDSVLQLK